MFTNAGCAENEMISIPLSFLQKLKNESRMKLSDIFSSFIFYSCLFVSICGVTSIIMEAYGSPKLISNKKSNLPYFEQYTLESIEPERNDLIKMNEKLDLINEKIINQYNELTRMLNEKLNTEVKVSSEVSSDESESESE
jgi:hypothetical protein